jgi:hypothetical protein
MTLKTVFQNVYQNSKSKLKIYPLKCIRLFDMKRVKIKVKCKSIFFK